MSPNPTRPVLRIRRVRIPTMGEQLDWFYAERQLEPRAYDHRDPYRPFERQRSRKGAKAGAP